MSSTIKQDKDDDNHHRRRRRHQGIVLYMRAQISGSSRSINYSNKNKSISNNLRSIDSPTKTTSATTTTGKGKVVLINPAVPPSVIISSSSSSSSSSPSSCLSSVSSSSSIPSSSPLPSPSSSSSSSSTSVAIIPSLYLHPRTFLQRFICLILSVVLLRRHAVLLLAPLLYVSGMLLYMANINSMDTPFLYNYILLPSSSSSSSSSPPLPGSRYRSYEAFQRFWPQMLQNDQYIASINSQNINASSPSTTPSPVSNVWTHSSGGGYWKPCLQSSNSSLGFQESNGFIIVEANGGLNQQRSSICNAVAVASLLNATLVIPKFHLNSVWKDRSSFGDIYDEEHFINSLAHRVRIVKQIPNYIMERYEHNLSLIYNFKVKAWAPSNFYRERVLPKLLETGILRISPFANRLSYREVTPGIQQLRCFANFESLRFAKPIAILGEKLVQRMKEKSAGHGGKYVAVHLRFEEDMVAFSCCVYDGDEKEKQDLDAAREKGWRGKFQRPGRVIKPDAIRMNGKCPMTPLEVGLMLRGMGFHNDTPIFIAAGKIYKSEQSMAPLLQMFPSLYTKDTLLSAEDLRPFKNFSSRLAALDYTVCLHSEVFVTTQGGNFPQFLIGHRRYLNNGHSMTIKPDKRKLAALLDKDEIGWEMFAREMQDMKYHSDFKGHELRKPDASIYTYPSPDCMCEQN